MGVGVKGPSAASMLSMASCCFTDEAIKKPGGDRSRTVLWIAVYMLVSSMMLIVNKLAISFLRAPSFILLCQLAMSAASVQLLSIFKLVELDRFSKTHLQPFSVVAMAFLGTIFANIKTLQYANVETFIIFRASTPLALCVLDYIFLGRHLPDRRSACCLLVLGGGAMGYVLSDKSFQVKGYFWVGMWFMVFLFDMIFLKHAADNVVVKSNWTRVFYSNFIPCLPLLVIGFWTKESHAVEWSKAGVGFLLLSCVMGIAMSYVSWQARSLVSATRFSIIGNVCKFLTIVVNCLIWDKHASPQGILCLIVCIVAAFFYKQAPLRLQRVKSSSEISLTEITDGAATATETAPRGKE